MITRNFNRLPRHKRGVFPSKDRFTFYHRKRRGIKPKKIKTRAFQFALIIILFILIGCFYVPGSSDHYPKNQNNVSNKDIARFFSKVKPSHSHIKSQYRYAIHLQKIGKHKISVEVLNDMAMYDPSNPKIYNALGISYDALADFERANQAYQKALKLDPNLDYVYNNLGYSQLLQKDYEDAKKSFRLAISLAAKNSDISKYENNLALANAKSGMLDDTVADNETVDNGDVEQPQADISTIEETVQMSGDAVDQAPKVNLAAADRPELDPQDGRPSVNYSDLETENAPHLPENSNLDNSNPNNPAIEIVKIAPETEVDSVQAVPAPQEKNIVAAQDVEQPQAEKGNIENKGQVEKIVIDQASKVHVAAVDSTDLHWEDDRPLADLLYLEKDSTQHSPENSNPDHPDLKVAKIRVEPNKKIDPIQLTPDPQEKKPVAKQYIEPPQPDISTIEETVQVPGDRIQQATEITIAAADKPELDPEDGRASADFSHAEKNSTPHLPNNPNPDNSNLGNSNYDAATMESEPEKEMYSVQVGALRQLENAEKLQRKLSDEVDNLHISEAHINGMRFYLVRVGPFNNILDAEITKSMLKSIKGVHGFTSKTTIKSEKDAYSVQVGAMLEFENADNLKRILSKEVENIYISEVNIQGRRYYRVRVGPFRNILGAENARRRLENVKGIKGFIAHHDLGAYAYDRAYIDEAITEADHVNYKAGIEVSNGNGINRMARRVGNFLSQKGFKIMRLTNAITFNIKKTIIYFTKGYREKAVYVESQFPGDQSIEEVQSSNRPGIQLKIVIGDDLRAHDRKLFVDDYETDGFASKETRYSMAGNGFGG